MERVKIFFYRYKSNIFRRTLKNILFFMTLLLVLQFNNTKCYAKEFNHGDMRSFVFELPDNLGKYTITGVYNSERSGNKWDVTSKNELVKRTSFLTSDDEKKFNSLSLFGAIIEGFRDSKNESGYSEYIVEFLETIAKLESDVNSEFILTSDLVPLTNREVLKKAKSGSITWGTSADSAKKYDKILKQGGKANYLIPEFLTENVNPFNMTNDMSVDEFFNAIKINNLRADHYMNDQSLFSLIVNSNSIPNICKDAGSIDVDEIISEDDELIDGHGYKARIIVDEIRIYISLYNRKGEAITSFILGDLFGTDTFKEKRYTNNSLEDVHIIYETSDDETIYYMKKKETTDISVANISLYYELGKDDKLKTIDKYSDRFETKEDKSFDSENEVFLAARDPQTNTIYIYAGEEKEKGKVLMEEVVTIEDSIVANYILNNSLTIEDGDWCYKLYSKDEIMAYKSDADNPLEEAFYINIGDLVYLYVVGYEQYANQYAAYNATTYNYDKYAKAFAPVKVGENSMYEKNPPKNQGIPFALIKSKSITTTNTTLGDVRKEIYDIIGNGTDKVTVDVKALKVGGLKGDSSKNPLYALSDVGTENNAYGEFPQNIPLNELLMSDKEMREEVARASFINAIISASLGDDKNEIKTKFASDLLNYGKIILIFLVFISIIYTSIISIFSGADARQRVLIKERFKHISIGILIFASTLPIFAIIGNFAKETMTEMPGIAATYTGSQFYTDATYEENFILGLIGILIDAVTDGINWLIDSIIVKSLIPNQEVSIMQLVFGVTDSSGNVSSLLPFSLNEWNLYLYGYRLLAAIAMALIGIALVKISGDIILAAGNYEKIIACKQSYMRIFLAIMGIVLAPYGFRILLLLFNYLTAMLPVDASSAEFDINFEEAGFVGSMANLTFATVRLRIYFLFMVRKIMIAFMLIVSPVVLGLWAISAKIRSASLWVGETLSNVALQFCYAMVFFVVMLITYEGQNPFITLILVMIIPKFASFFSSSLEGLAQRWGGINEEGVADRIVNYTKSAKETVVKGARFTGKLMTKGSNFFDPEKVTKTGRIISNTGNVINHGIGLANGLPKGNISDIASGINGHMTNNQLIENQLNGALDMAEEEKRVADTRFDIANYEKEKVIRNNPALEAYCENLETQPNAEEMMRSGAGYDEINEYIRAKKNKKLAKEKVNARKRRIKNYYLKMHEDIIDKNNKLYISGKDFGRLIPGKEGDIKENIGNMEKYIKNKKLEGPAELQSYNLSNILKDAMKQKNFDPLVLAFVIEMEPLVQELWLTQEGAFDESLHAEVKEYFQYCSEHYEKEEKMFLEKKEKSMYLKKLASSEKIFEDSTSTVSTVISSNGSLDNVVMNNAKSKDAKLGNTQSALGSTQLGGFSEVTQAIHDEIQVAKKILDLRQKDHPRHEKVDVAIGIGDVKVAQVTGKEATRTLHDNMSQNVSSLQGEQKTITNDPHTQALSNCSISIKKYTEAKEKLETARKELQRLNNTTKNDKERKEQKKREIDYLEKEYKESKRKAEEDYGAIENKFLSFDEFVESVNNTIKEFEAEISHSAGSSNISKGKKTAEKIKETGIAHGIKKDKRGNPFKK